MVDLPTTRPPGRNGTSPPDESGPSAVEFWEQVAEQGTASAPDRMTAGEQAAEMSGWKIGIEAERRCWRRYGHGLNEATSKLVNPDQPTPAEIEAERVASAGERYDGYVADEVRVLRIRRDARAALAADEAVVPRPLGFLEFLEQPQPELLIEGVFYVDSLVRVFGPPGCCKSFIALDWALRIALGMPWHRCPILRPGPVIFVMAEGARVNVARSLAWLAHNKIAPADLEGRFYAITEPTRLTPAGIAPVVELASRIGAAFVVLDTKNAMIDGDEDSATDAADMRRAMDMIRNASQACVVLVDHTGYTPGRARGSSAVTGQLDTEISVVRDQDTGRVSVKVKRDKGDEGGTVRELELVRVDSAAVVVPATSQAETAPLDDPAVTVPRPVADWQTAATVLPASVWQYEGLGGKGIRALARYMACDASVEQADPGRVGRTRAEAVTEVVATGLTDNRTVRRAWSVLIKMGHLQAVGRAGATGHHVWVASTLPPSEPVQDELFPAPPAGSFGGLDTVGHGKIVATPVPPPSAEAVSNAATPVPPPLSWEDQSCPTVPLIFPKISATPPGGLGTSPRVAEGQTGGQDTGQDTPGGDLQ